MFIDELTLKIKAGDGGDGVVRWLHEKNKEYSGPAGGNGGKGGDLYVVAVRDINRLAAYRSVGSIAAEKGGAGAGKGRHGANGRDAEVVVPVGSLVSVARGARVGRQYELLQEGERVKILMGGRGGLGNKYFKGSRNTQPTEWTAGMKGEAATIQIELRLIADAGLIGLPNAGKSSLLNALTRARAKVGAYQFTTLEPNLGDFGGYILADIPGLIEGASEGKGLGYKFLRHSARTRLLIHLVSLEHPDMCAAYQTVRAELVKYNPAFAEKEEVIVLTKTDVLRAPELKKAVTAMKKLNLRVLTVSLYDDESLAALKKSLLAALKAQR